MCWKQGEEQSSVFWVNTILAGYKEKCVLIYVGKGKLKVILWRYAGTLPLFTPMNQSLSSVLPPAGTEPALQSWTWQHNSGKLLVRVHTHTNTRAGTRTQWSYSLNHYNHCEITILTFTAQLDSKWHEHRICRWCHYTFRNDKKNIVYNFPTINL